MPETLPKDQILAAEVKDGRLIISIGISALAFAVKNGDGLVNEDFEITDEEGFARDVVNALENEDNCEGDTLVHAMLDRAAEIAIENGSEHCSLDGE